MPARGMTKWGQRVMYRILPIIWHQKAGLLLEYTLGIVHLSEKISQMSQIERIRPGDDVAEVHICT